ncbi:serine/threonine protein kinase [Streptomyces sp. ISL-36]|uniref:serine/threonine-protein kinase n=1 Tax=Streptomyces sp. ISL-36 TaxID=2819182 RepID=UPI001BE98A8F|nr:serine/threonine-protein kinase [Streptomyces sp. ISL-36]MBT2439415.1 serine/threonine protein kinase [Streptomyces sp. ISL-36]
MTGARVEELRGDDPRQLGQYRLLGRLGSGGMGRVYLGRTRGGRLVAVKTLLAEGVVGETDRRRFAREVALAQRVTSVYTAQVLDADATADRPWMAIEYIAAPSLAELVRAKGVLQASAVRWVAAGTAEALVTLHRMGIVHRDVKPQNILLPLAGPRLIDFGISHASDLTRTQLTLGTIAFTSPEQARGEESTAAADVYSLGATLFHLAVGRPPYPEDGDTLRLLSRVQRGDLDLGGLPKELTPLIRPCLAAEPAARPEPAAVLEQFTASISGLPNSPSGNRWLPPRWTELIGAYESQGRRFQETGAREAEAPTVDQRTSAVPPPDPTRVLPEERERRADRAQAAQAARAAQAAMAAALAAQEEALRRARASGTPPTGRTGAARSGPARTPAARTPAARTPAARTPAARTSPPRTPPARTPPAPAPAPSGGGGGRSGGGWFGIFLLALVAFFFYQANTDDGSGSSGSGSSSSRSTYGSTYTPPPTPTPDAEDRSFRSVDSGDCLTAFDDGYDSWSTGTPQTVSCSAANAYLRVTSATEGIDFADCPSGNGRGYWYHSGSRYDFATTLCVERQFRKGQCFVAKRSGDTITSSRTLNLWNCDATKVPKGYNTVLQITGYYKAEKSYPAGYCSRGRDDRNVYWTYEVDGGRNVLCTTAV